MARRRYSEEVINHEAWAVPYSDLVTLLLAFFVVMYAISSVNEGNYKMLADALHEAFGGNPDALARKDTPEDTARRAEQTTQPILPIARGSIIDLPVKRWLNERPNDGIDETPEVRAAVAAQMAQAQALDRLGQQLKMALGDLVDQGQVDVQRRGQWLNVEIKADILFGSGSAELGPEALTTLARVADVLAPVPNAVKVEGHTDNAPIQSLQYPSNWELSAARSASVVKLFAGRGVATKRLSVVGYGAEHPRADNATPEGRNANRRVILVIMAAPDEPAAGAKVQPLAADNPVTMQELP